MINKEQILQLPLEEVETEIAQDIISQSMKKQVTIGVFGSFSVGKSALLNSVLQTEDLLPTHTKETTAHPTYIKYGSTLKIEKVKVDGAVDLLLSDEFRTYIAEGNVTDIEYLNIEYPGPEWMKDIMFVDTPGRNTKFESHIKASENAILNSDAAIYVMPWNGLTLEDIVYLQKITMYQPNIYFVVNKIDRIESSQGITPEDICHKVKKDLKEQLGREFPVFAISVKTGEHLEQFVKSCLIDIAKRSNELKAERFEFAICQFLLGIQKRLQEEVYLLEVVNSSDTSKVDSEYQKITVERNRLQEEVEEKVHRVQQRLNQEQEQLLEMIQQEADLLEQEILQLVNKNKENPSEQLNLEIQHALLKARNNIVARVQGRLNIILEEQVQFKVEAIQAASGKIEPTEYDLKDILELFEREREVKINMYMERKQKLEELQEQEVQMPHTEEIEEELMILQSELSKEYVPKMITKTQRNSGEATKALRAVGIVADIAASVALAMGTAGASAGVQVAGKSAAKTVGGKATKKVALKQATNKVGREVLEKGMIIATEKSNKNEKIISGLRALDKITSPFETIATSIGRTIDGEDVEYEVEDLNYRQQFYVQKSEVESRYAEKRFELNRLYKQMDQQSTMQQQITLKIEKLEKEQQAELERQEREMNIRLEKEKKERKQANIERQIHEILNAEIEQYRLWVQLELEKAGQAVAISFPRLSEGKLNRWQEKLDEVVQLKQDKKEQAELQLKEKEHSLRQCQELLEQVQNA